MLGDLSKYDKYKTTFNGIKIKISDMTFPMKLALTQKLK